jgi:hypothetical protein
MAVRTLDPILANRRRRLSYRADFVIQFDFVAPLPVLGILVSCNHSARAVRLKRSFNRPVSLLININGFADVVESVTLLTESQGTE